MYHLVSRNFVVIQEVLVQIRLFNWKEISAPIHVYLSSILCEYKCLLRLLLLLQLCLGHPVIITPWCIFHHIMQLDQYNLFWLLHNVKVIYWWSSSPTQSSSRSNATSCGYRNWAQPYRSREESMCTLHATISQAYLINMSLMMSILLSKALKNQ